jgi:hypothetical protein
MVYPMVRGDDQRKMRILERDTARPEITEGGHYGVGARAVGWVGRAVAVATRRPAPRSGRLGETMALYTARGTSWAGGGR